MNQSELQANTATGFKRGKTRANEARIGFGFVSHWLRSGPCFANQSLSVVKRTRHSIKNRSNPPYGKDGGCTFYHNTLRT